jgi:G3E family GTPase
VKATINVVTGILGAGKTTALKHLIEGPGIEGVPAVVVGEYAEEGFDGDMLRASGAHVAELTNTGTGQDAVSYLAPVRSLLASSAHNRIYLETSGVTQISKVARDLASDPFISEHAQIGRTTTVLDAGAFTLHTQHFATQLWAQVAVADVVVVNKSDKAHQDSLETIRTTIQTRYPHVKVFFAYMGQIMRQEVLGPLEDGFQPAILKLDFQNDPPAEFESFVYRSDEVCYDQVLFGHRLLNLPGGQIARFKGKLRFWDRTQCLNGFPGQLDWDSTPVTGGTAIAFIGLGLEARRDEIQQTLNAELASQKDDGRG